jgi:hypothetical protein
MGEYVSNILKIEFTVKHTDETLYTVGTQNYSIQIQ